MEITRAASVTKSICMGLPQLLACLDVEKRHGEENNGEEQHHSILHCKSLNSSGHLVPAGNVTLPGSAQEVLSAQQVQSDISGQAESQPRNDSGLVQI
jgi:hypothetical protein